MVIFLLWWSCLVSYIVFMFAFSSLGVNAMDIWNDNSLSEFILLDVFSYSPYDFFLFPLSFWPLLLPWLTTSSSSCSLRLTGDCTPPCAFFSASSLSWTWPWWVQWCPRWQLTLSQEVNSFLRAAVPLRSSKWSVLAPGSHGLWHVHGCGSHPVIGTLCSWNGRLAIWWPGILGEWSSWLTRAWSSASPTVALSDGQLLLWVSHPAAPLLCRHIPLRGPHLCLLCGHAAAVPGGHCGFLGLWLTWPPLRGNRRLWSQLLSPTCGAFTMGEPIFRYMQKASARTSVGERATFICYTIFTPMLNPLIYRLSNMEVMRALQKVLGTWRM